MPDIIERNATCARQLLEAGAEIERLRAAFKDILLLDGKQMTARQKYAHSATLAERALNPHGQSSPTEPAAGSS